jgi:hypothetical protein
MTRNDVVVLLLRIQSAIGTVQDEINAFVLALMQSQVVGIEVLPDAPAASPLSPKEKRSMSATKLACVFAPPGTRRKVAAPGGRAAGVPVQFTITDVGNGNYKVWGTDAAGFDQDISAVAKIAVADSDQAVAVSTPDATLFDTFNEKGVSPGANKVTITATWNDGSIGPFAGEADFTVTGSTVTGLDVKPTP